MDGYRIKIDLEDSIIYSYYYKNEELLRKDINNIFSSYSLPYDTKFIIEKVFVDGLHFKRNDELCLESCETENLAVSNTVTENKLETNNDNLEESDSNEEMYLDEDFYLNEGLGDFLENKELESNTN